MDYYSFSVEEKDKTVAIFNVFVRNEQKDALCIEKVWKKNVNLSLGIVLNLSLYS